MFGPEEFEAIQQPLRDGWVVQGKQVGEFEASFSEFVGSPYSLACSSGTAALHIAVIAMGIKPGDEVIVPGFTWIATANVVELTGAQPVFCDINLESFNINPELITDSVTSRTVGVIPVHLFGWCAEMEPVLELARNKELWTVEDATCALGGWYRGKHAGTIGDIGCFSFHPRKSITTGEGGMVTTSEEMVARICDGLRNHGACQRQTDVGGKENQGPMLPEYSLAGFNYRLTDIQGALGLAQLRRINFLLAERRRCAERYAESLSDLEWLRLPAPPKDVMVHAWQSYVTLFAPEEPTMENVDRLHMERNRLMNTLQRCGIATRQGTHAPPHLDYYARKYQIRPEDYPASYIADRLSLALPLYPGISDEEIDYVIENVRSFRRSKRQ
jgi:dTDP-4-amino-4,6-dideoxygalactose transaminase